MFKNKIKLPNDCYGVLLREEVLTTEEEIVEQIFRLGYAVLDSGYSEAHQKKLSDNFNKTRKKYFATYGEVFLQNIDEHNTIRAMCTLEDQIFLKLALNKKIIKIIEKIILGQFILNQQNGIINPPNQNYNQGKWHRDLPYQHFTSSTPLAINAIYCIDDFTENNGSTLVLPGSHKIVNFPSNAYINNNTLQIQAKAGSFIILDCMLFHAGGFNHSNTERRAINNVYTIPYFKQQIIFSTLRNNNKLTNIEKRLLDLNYDNVNSIKDYLNKRIRK